MSLPAGWAEFNDATAVIRGTLAGANGTFSGTFAADNVNAVSGINIKDGAVSGYMGFDINTAAMSVTVVIPPMPNINVMDIILPIEVYQEGNTGNNGGTISVYKNGSLWATERITSRLGVEYVRVQGKGEGSTGYAFSIYTLQVMRLVDFYPSQSGNTTISVTLSNHSGSGYIDGAITDNSVSLKFTGPMVVGGRKR